MRIPVTLALAAVLAVPSAVAAWGAKGDLEPSTGFDVRDGYMFTTANQAPVNKVYFNGWLAQQPCYNGCLSQNGVTTVTSFNPNVASQQSAVMAAPSIAYAMLGVWRDCNKDGYVGYGDQGLFEYPVQLPGVDASVCPVTQIGQWVEPNAMPPHNDGGLVREFLPIGWNSMPVNLKCPTPFSSCQDVDPFNVADNAARVWSDFGTPGTPPGNLCYVTPQPRGTFHSVGSLQGYADCFLQNRVNGTVTGTPYDGVRGADCEHSSVAGTYHAGCNPWGESNQDAYVDAFDCSQRQTTGPYEPTTKTWTVNVSKPYASPRTNREGSVAGTFNETWGDLDDCRENNRDNTFARQADPNVPYATEGDTINTNGKRLTHDNTFTYQERKRAAAPQPVFGAFSKQGSGDFGLGTTREADFWEGDGVMLASRNPYVARDALQPAPVTYVTYYASLGATAVSRYALQTTGQTGTYGAEACGSGIGAGQPMRNDWACDPTAWWPGADCTQTSLHCPLIDGRPQAAFVRVGQAYQLRDVDCYDAGTQALRDNGLTYHGLVANSYCQ